MGLKPDTNSAFVAATEDVFEVFGIRAIQIAFILF
jgi:hypothetical protein